LDTIKPYVDLMKQSLRCILPTPLLLLFSTTTTSLPIIALIPKDCAKQKIISLPRLCSTGEELISIFTELKLDCSDMERDLRSYDEEYIEASFANLDIVAGRCRWYICNVTYASFVSDQVLKMFRQLPKVCGFTRRRRY
jgi:hypothetical protein